MFIDSITIDGFKSYQQRTTILGFDPQFNAITGLNGSGKSNILDAICFVLGITQLQNVRAERLQDLVFKQGQAGIIRAVVSIAFNNKDKGASPLGYEQYEQIIVTRTIVPSQKKNKYLLNGSNASPAKISDLFRSVQLNVNNPHFLIMQGRITKVLNMKPPEILSMVEEAAGTRMYETKRQSAIGLIKKKDTKIAEIEETLQTDITPKLEQMDAQRKDFQELQQLLRRIEHSVKLMSAYRYVCLLETITHCVAQVLDREKKLEEMTSREIVSKQRVDEIRADQKVVREHRQSVLAEDKVFDKDLKTCQANEAKILATLDDKNDSIKDQQKRIGTIKTDIEKEQKLISKREKELDSLRNSFKDVEEQATSDKKMIEDAQTQLQALATGMTTDDDGHAASLPNLLIASKKKLAEAQTQCKASTLRMKQNEGDLKAAQAKIRKNDGAHDEKIQSLGTAEKELAQLETKLGTIDFSEENENALVQQRNDVRRQCNHLMDQADQYAGQCRIPNLNFDYRDPGAGFDPAGVKGAVCRLFTVKDPAKYAMALTNVAGGKLNNVVVDTPQTSSALLQPGMLKMRTTFIPLSKINASVLRDNQIRNAEKLVGKDNAIPAINLINFSRDVEPAMKFVFGNAFVCENIAVAKKIAFSPEVQALAITLEGDVFNPSGTASGGFQEKGANSIQLLNEWHKCQSQIEGLRNKTDDFDNRLASMTKNAAEYRKLKSQATLKTQEVSQLRDQLKQTDHQQLLDSVESLRAEKDELIQTEKDASEMVTKMQAKIADVQEKIKSGPEWVEKQKKSLSKQLQDAQKRVESSDDKLKSSREKAETLDVEIESLKKEIDEMKKEQQQCLDAIETFKGEIVEQQAGLVEAREMLKQKEGDLHAFKKRIRVYDDQIAEFEALIEKINKEMNALELKYKKVEQEMVKLKNDRVEAQNQKASLLHANSWISKEEHLFNKPGTRYDFAAQDMTLLESKMKQMREDKQKLSGGVNQRAMTSFTKTQEQFDKLLEHKAKIESDKEQLYKTIRDIDKDKLGAVEKAWNEVNKEFGEIYNLILPGTNAKLVPKYGSPKKNRGKDGAKPLEGLEIKVAFNDDWKDSLDDLSGGQRSLVALSLILSMLTFKPAPLYILDEVDSALDLSHTQNIGHLIRKKFLTSQFIIVSLKDGMFNNANVLFRTKLVDSYSTVCRQTFGSKNVVPADQPLKEDEIQRIRGAMQQLQYDNSENGTGDNTKAKRKKV